jgi:single-strand DNA-binding protein
MYDITIIAGNLGRNPEMRYTPSGQAVTSFSVATNKQYTNAAGETIKTTKWFRVSSWGKQAEIANKYLLKGSKVLIEGDLTCDPTTGGPKIWTGQDGGARASFELNSKVLRFLGGTKGNDAPAESPVEDAGTPEAVPATPTGDIDF